MVKPSHMIYRLHPPAGVGDASEPFVPGIGTFVVIGAIVAFAWYATNSTYLVEAYDKGSYRKSLAFYGTFFDRDVAEDQARDLRKEGYEVSLRTLKDSFSR